MVANRRWRHSEWWMHKNVSAKEMPLHVGGDYVRMRSCGLMRNFNRIGRGKIIENFESRLELVLDTCLLLLLWYCTC
jgi:hypothetical protein